MKKLFAILLFAIYLFNLVGYSIMFDYFINRTDKQLVKQMDRGAYTDAELTEIKVPIQLPYAPNQMQYERWDGEIELNGIHYNYVKRKIYNDTLFILCLPNNNKTQLYKAKNEYAGSINETGTASSGKKQSESFAKKGAFENDYDNHISGYNFSIPVPAIKHYYIAPFTLITRFVGSPKQPPEIFLPLFLV